MSVVTAAAPSPALAVQLAAHESRRLLLHPVMLVGWALWLVATTDALSRDEITVVQASELVVCGRGGGQVGFDPRVVAAGVEVVEPPFRQGVGLQGSIHSEGLTSCASRFQRAAITIGAIQAAGWSRSRRFLRSCGCGRGFG